MSAGAHAALAPLYGVLPMPTQINRPPVTETVVTLLDGVTALNAPSYASGGPIKGDRR